MIKEWKRLRPVARNCLHCAKEFHIAAYLANEDKYPRHGRYCGKSCRSSEMNKVRNLTKKVAAR